MGRVTLLRRVLVLLAATLVVTGAMVATPASVASERAAATTGSMTGTLVLPAGVSPSSVRVTAQLRIPDCCGGWAGTEDVGTTTPDASGSYTFTGLEPGWYYVEVVDLAERLYVKSWADRVGQDEPSPSARVTSSVVTTMPIGTLAIGGQVVGSVSSDVPGRSVVGVHAQLQDLWCHPRGCVYRAERSAPVSADGTYRFSGIPGRAVPPGDGYGAYRITFVDEKGWFVQRGLGQGPGEHWAGVPVGVADGKTHDVGDQQLQLGGQVTGRVRVPAGHVEGTSVEAYAWSEQDSRWDPVGNGWASGGGEGDFTIPSLAPGRYRLKATSMVPDEIPEEWYDGAATVEEALDVVVRAGRATTGIDIDLRPPGSGPEPEPEPEVRPVRMATAPKLKGVARVGRTLRVTRGAWRPGRVTLARQWFVVRKGRSVPIKGATKARLKVTRALRGARVRVRVTATAPGRTAYVHTTARSRRIPG